VNDKVCGICGTAGFEDKSLLREVCSLMRHHGPDDSGMFLDVSVGLGHHQVRIRMETTSGSICRWIL